MIRKAVLPVAGLGTRFLPASKAIPKEMLSVVDKPVIQLVVEEAIAAGIKEIILVTHAAKKAIEDHFDTHYELEHTLAQRGKTELLQTLRELLPSDVRVISVRQGQPLGLGHAILCAREVVGDQPFAVLLPDVLVDNHQQDQTDLALMNQRFAQTGQAQILVDEVARERVHQYGIVALQQGQTLAAGDFAAMQAMVEKPSAEAAPSRLAVVGRYVLPAQIFHLLEKTQPGAGNEIQLTDALDQLLSEQGAEAYRMQGVTYDCGDKLGYLQATLAYGLRHPQVGADFAAYLRQSLLQQG